MISVLEYAAIHLKVPMSGNAELDKMIRLARRLDWNYVDPQWGTTKEWQSICDEPSGEAGKWKLTRIVYWKLFLGR